MSTAGDKSQEKPLQKALQLNPIFMQQVYQV